MGWDGYLQLHALHQHINKMEVERHRPLNNNIESFTESTHIFSVLVGTENISGDRNVETLIIMWSKIQCFLAYFRIMFISSDVSIYFNTCKKFQIWTFYNHAIIWYYGYNNEVTLEITNGNKHLNPVYDSTHWHDKWWSISRGGGRSQNIM